MTCIGTFTATRDGFAGRLQTLTIDRALTLVTAEAGDAGNAPDYRVLAGEGEDSFEVGAGWKRTGDKAGAYVAVLIDDPALGQPLRANLFQSDQRTHVLMWSRSARREAKD
ncbi:DUF736 domain-containing protein [Porphyrobacter sp. ULC335]|uniref:DUF736 domain-containing protein n=1 Tax=Porphyrobacter sp. ULC335 TaxID=2854260 RepID=UPI00221E59BA|nr:DUF736 domain-containing protein [Porphyrobacter sp. ULC335]UYV16661.1 DUF736 domain-containing protein [Porphyrobacter sp. ULC335]